LPGAAEQAGGFQSVNLSAAAGGEAQQEDAEAVESGSAGPAIEDTLGQASSSDAFLMNGTIGQGDTGPGAGGLGFQGGEFGRDGFGGPGGPGGLAIGGAPGVPSVQGVPGAEGFPAGAGPGAALAGGPGGPGGGFAGAVRGGGGGFGGGGGGGGRGGGGGGGRGGGPGRGARPGQGGGPQQLYGLARLARQRANRIRFGLTDDYSNSALDARPYSLSGGTSPKTGSWRDTVGGSLGGPLRIPKVYDGTDRTFVFLNFNFARGNTVVDQYSTVPTLAERQGDFSDRGVQLFDPFSSGTPWGSVIPSNFISPTATGLLQYIPEPNLPGLVQNYHLQSTVPTDTDRLNARVNHALSSKLSLNAVYNIQIGNSHSIDSFPDFQRNQSTRGQSLTLGLTQNLSRTFINSTQFSFTRNRSQSLNLFAFQQDIAGELGITGVSTNPIDYGVPQLAFTNFTGANDPVPSLVRNQTFRFVDNVSILRNKHTVRFGGEVRKMENNMLSNPTPRGAFTFSGALTSQLDASGQPAAGTGFDFADFLLGLPISTNLRFGTPATYFRNWAFSGYFNDDWRVTSKFSLTLGVRYDAVTPATELYNHIANLDVNSSFTQAAVVVPGQAGPFSGPLPNSLVRGDYNNWSPRIGLAWRPPFHHQVTVRAGYGMMYNGQVYSQFASSLASQPPFAQAETLQSTSSQVLTLQKGFPTGSTNALRNTIAIDPNYTLAYAQIWNLSVETPLFRNMPIGITYTGTKGTHLDTLLGFSSNPLTAAQSSVVQNAQGFTYDTSSGNSIFHALNVRMQGRVNRNLRFGANYTLSKSVDDASSIGGGQQVIAQDSNDIAAQRGLSSFDMRHQFRANYTYDLPFGERQRFARGGLASTLFGDWSISNTLIVHSGTPFTARVFDSACQILPGVYSERADQVADPSLPSGQQTVQQFFNTAAFVAPASGCIGNAPRNTIIGPGSFTLNMDLAKNFRLGRDGQHNMQIHWQVNNLTNTPNFTGLSTVVNSSTFGRVTGVSGMRSMTLHLRMNF
jgi:TonB dependent receptor-like, beta-barrel